MNTLFSTIAAMLIVYQIMQPQSFGGWIAWFILSEIASLPLMIVFGFISSAINSNHRDDGQ